MLAIATMLQVQAAAPIARPVPFAISVRAASARNEFTPALRACGMADLDPPS